MSTSKSIKKSLNRIYAVIAFISFSICNIFAQTNNVWDGEWLGKNQQGDLVINLKLNTENPKIVNPYDYHRVNTGFITISAIEPSGNKTVLQTFELILESKEGNTAVFKYQGGRENVDNSNGKCKAVINDGQLSFSIINNEGDDPLFTSINISKDNTVIAKQKTKNIINYIFSGLVLIAYIAMIIHMIYIKYKGVRYKKALTVEEMKAERIAQNKPEEMSPEEFNEALTLLAGVFDTWTVVGQNDEGEELRKPTKMKQVKASSMLLDQAIALQPTDKDMIDNINELADVINSNEERFFDGSKPLAWLGGIVGIIFLFISPQFGIITLISTGAYILSSRTPVFLIEKRQKRGGGNIHNGIIAGVFGMIAGAQTVRTVYKYSDGHKEYEDDNSQHWIAWILGLAILVCIAATMALWAMINYLRNYVLYF
ncbi:hypothetical protein [uncultured Bacteroides sp.]|uniref:hypothetical protein n=1 Tax=uncultured Bacteroides sp. TaxID=162156 RepID=UPI0025954EAA|nr:hypothetical protein [uncultured Bacteroides sp.]